MKLSYDLCQVNSGRTVPNVFCVSGVKIVNRANKRQLPECLYASGGMRVKAVSGRTETAEFSETRE